MMKENALQMNLIRAMKHAATRVNVSTIALSTPQPATYRKGWTQKRS
jgi:hypothetical protein